MEERDNPPPAGSDGCQAVSDPSRLCQSRPVEGKRRGPAPKATEEECAEVLALVVAGHSYSEVAARVFGAARLRGRVARIIAREQRAEQAGSLDELLAAAAAELAASPVERDAEHGSRLEQLVPLYGAMLKRDLEQGVPVKGRELLAFAELELRLENWRMFERARALTRSR